MAAIGIARYARRDAAIWTAAAVLAVAAIALAAWRLTWALAAAAVLPAALWAGVMWFFRDPDRSAPADGGLLVSPADGRVTDVTPVGSDGPLGRPGVQIGIFMNLLDVHVNRCPEAASVAGLEHHAGTFLDARDERAWSRNESATLHLAVRTARGEQPLVVRQVAGKVARRIITDVRVGQRLARGQRIGMIKFGSRVEVLAPRELVGEVRVRVGQRVQAGRTVLIQTPAGDVA